MSQNVKTEASAPPARQNDKSSSWADALPMSVDKEDTMNAKDVNICWNKILKAIGLTSASESERKLVKAGVYVYGALNGTSRAGLYNGKITMANGTSFSASVIPIATGKYDIRRFFRGCADDSYEFFKSTGVMETYGKMVVKAEDLGIPARDAFAMADWLGGCQLMTISERNAHDKSFSYSITRAAHARQDQTLEQVEAHVVENSLAAQAAVGTKFDEGRKF